MSVEDLHGGDVTLGEIVRRFDRLENALAAREINYVQKDLFHAENEATRGIATSARTIAMWALGLMVTALIGAVVMALLNMAAS